MEREESVVLFVDDESINTLVFEESFKRYFNVITARSGREALDKMSRYPVKVLVTDQLMPEMSGLELCEIVNSTYPHVVCMIATALSDSDTLLKAINQGGIFQYFLKPWKRHELKIAISNALNLNKLKRQNFLLNKNLKVRSSQLRHSDYKYKTIVDNTIDVIFTCDARGIVTFISSTIERYGYHADDVIGKSIFNFIYKEDLDYVTGEFQRALSTQQSIPVVFRTKNKYGEVIYVEERGKVDLQGGDFTITGVIRNVHEQVLAEQSLEKALNEIESLKNKLEEENIYLKQEIKLNNNYDNIITRDPRFNALLNQLEQVAKSDASVLIHGETGTGKELIAMAVHSKSTRCDNALIKLNCAAVPENLIESELFGHEKGAFTGAIQQRKGKFELANGGTLFLDEIGEMPYEMQAKLLRVLQEGELERVGGSKPIKVDVRVIAATNRELDKEVREKRFRGDLYYRLNVFPITLPPLRERKTDIPLLTDHFIQGLNRKTGKNIRSIAKACLQKLIDYSWPGNIRELQNIIERAHIVSSGTVLKIGQWLPDAPINNDSSLVTLDDMMKEYIIKVLESVNWRISGEKGAAKILGLKPTTLESRMKKLGIERFVNS
ncbi:response regulator [Marinilabiliaceae bacterium JC017]|nr:response regulator [Marinilabiliaceae bacterium JC017]